MIRALQRLGLVVTVVIVCAGCGTRATIEGERAKLQGTWEVVAGEARGVRSLASVGNRYTFEGGSFQVSGHAKIAYELNVHASPAQMDWPTVTTSGEKKLTGKARAIYSIASDELRICVATWDDHPRPTSFTTSPDSHTELMILKRIKRSPKGSDDHEGSNLPDSWFQNQAYYKLQPATGEKHLGKYDVDFYQVSTGPRGIPRIEDISWGYLVDLRDVRKLVLRACPGVGDAEMRYVARLICVERLDLNSTDVADGGVARLAGHQELEHLDLSFTDVTDSAVSSLLAMKGLKEVVLSGSAVTRDGVAALRDARKDLKVVWTRAYAKPEREAARTLARLGFAVSDDRDYYVTPDRATCQITTHGHVHIQDPRVVALAVNRRAKEDGQDNGPTATLVDGLISRLPAPTAVALGNSARGDTVFLLLRNVQGLVRLDLSQTEVSDAGLTELKRHQTLEVLDVSCAKRVTEKGVAALADLPKLRVLNVRGLKVTPAGLMPLTNLQNLKVLTLDRTALSDKLNWELRQKRVELRLQ
jgi:uncharacterized protein (TIGR03067 family)